MQQVIMLLNTCKNNKHHTRVKQKQTLCFEASQKQAFGIASNQLAFQATEELASHALGTPQGCHTHVMSGSAYR